MSNAKRIPLERLDFSIYKPSANQVASRQLKKDYPFGLKQWSSDKNMAALFSTAKLPLSWRNMILMMTLNATKFSSI
jgi:hypothetical protein